MTIDRDQLIHFNSNVWAENEVGDRRKSIQIWFLFKFLPVEYEEEIIWKSLSESTPAIKLTP